jgi:hypothetical protein
MTSQPPTLPDPLPAFQLDALCLPDRGRLASLVIRTGTGTFTDLHEPFRAATRLLGIPSEMAGQHAFGFARAMSISVREGLVVLGEQFRGLGIGGTIPWRAGIYPWEFLVQPTPPRDPAFLPLRLFELKNSPTERGREAFSAIQREFERLAHGRSFDVTFTATEIPVPAVAPIGAGQVAVPGGNDETIGSGSVVTVVAWPTPPAGQPRRERPIQLFGSGTWEALVLAEALVTSAGSLTVLDEPGVTLHPTWQAVLRGALREAPGQVLLVTHSPSLVPMETANDLLQLARLDNGSGATRIHRLPTKLTTKAFAKMTRAFALSADARALLFCRGAVLMEGETELGAIPIWCAKSRAALELGTPSDLDLAFYTVSGDGGFANIVSVLHAFDIPWVIICDGALFDIQTKWGSHVFRQIERGGAQHPDLVKFTQRVSRAGKSARIMTQSLWEEEVALGAANGVLTLATGWTSANEAIESFFERTLPGKLAEAKAQVGDSKTRIGRWIAQVTTCPSDRILAGRPLVFATASP